jgi:hypothetical protein
MISIVLLMLYQTMPVYWRSGPFFKGFSDALYTGAKVEVVMEFVALVVIAVVVL